MAKKQALKPVDRLLKCYLKKLKEMGYQDYRLREMFKEEIPEPMERYRARLRVEKLLHELKDVKQDPYIKERISPFYFL